MLTKSKIKLNTIAALAVLAVILVGLSVKNYVDYLANKKAYLAEDKKLVALKEEIRMIENSLEKFDREKKEFEKYLFQDKDIPAFLDGISKYAVETEVNIVDMKTKSFQQVALPDNLAQSQSKLAQKRQENKAAATVDKKELQEMITLAAMPIDMQLEGEFPALMKFLGALEDFPQLLTVSNIKIALTKNEYPILKCDFVLKIYSTKDLRELETQQ